MNAAGTCDVILPRELFAIKVGGGFASSPPLPVDPWDSDVGASVSETRAAAASLLESSASIEDLGSSEGSCVVASTTVGTRGSRRQRCLFRRHGASTGESLSAAGESLSAAGESSSASARLLVLAN